MSGFDHPDRLEINSGICTTILVWRLRTRCPHCPIREIHPNLLPPPPSPGTRWFIAANCNDRCSEINRLTDASELKCHPSGPSSASGSQTNIPLKSQQHDFFLPFFFLLAQECEQVVNTLQSARFPLNPHLNRASPRRRSYQYVPHSQTMWERANVIVSLRWNDSVPSGRSICTRNQRFFPTRGNHFKGAGLPQQRISRWLRWAGRR